MSMGLRPAYCARCHSHHCPCAIQINEHNLRMKYDGAMMGVSNGPVTAARWPSDSASITPFKVAQAICGTVNHQTIVEPPFHKEPPNKKLLLLRSSGI